MKIVVIEALGLHLGYLGCYGNDWTGTPNLDGLAAEGIVFDWHYADQPELQPLTPWPQRSVATGRYALPGDPPPLSEAVRWPRVLRCEAMEHFAVQALAAIEALDTKDAWLWIEGPSLLPPWQMDDDLLNSYFDEDDMAEGLAPWKDPPCELAKLSEAETVELQNTYAAVVTYFDAQLGALVEQLRAKGILDDLLLCVTARSGLPLGEHGMIGTPQPGLHDELVHVPLVMRLPGAAEAGLRIAALTQPLDLAATFAEAASSSLHGHNLWPLMRGEIEHVRPYAVAALRVGARESRLLRLWEWGLHVSLEPDSAARLFAKPEDRWEVSDLYHQQTELAEQMEKALRAFAEAIRQAGALVYPRVM